MYRGRRHVFTVAESLLDGLVTRPGPLSLVEWEPRDGGSEYRVSADSRLRFADLRFTGEPLYAAPRPSFPPFPAVCLSGSGKVADWLAGQGLTRHDYWQVGGDLEAGYTEEWVRRSALHENAADLIVGGWHFLWPEDDYFLPPEVRLVALTLRDAEPWVEVWYSRPRFGYQARPRVS